jgi:hypothetical protein
MELWALMAFAVILAVVFGVRLQRQWDAEASADDEEESGAEAAETDDDGGSDGDDGSDGDGGSDD